MAPQDSEVDVAIRHGAGDDIGYFLAHDSTGHAVPNIAPIGKVPVEILAEIFFQCIDIPSGQHDGLHPRKCKFVDHPQTIRKQLGQVCQMWNNIIDNDPRIWATFILYGEFLDPEMVSLWIEKSKSHPLDVFFWSDRRSQHEERAILAMLHKELWRIRIFAGDIIKRGGIKVLFPLGVLTEAPMMQTCKLWNQHRLAYMHKGAVCVGGVHCPQLHSLTISYIGIQGFNLFVKPMENVHRLDISYYGPIHSYLNLLDLMPNLVSLTWRDIRHQQTKEELPRFNIRSLRYLTLVERGTTMLTRYLACLLNESPDTFSGDGNNNLRYLRLGNAIPKETDVHAILHVLKHLKTLVLDSQHDHHPVDALLLALSPLNQNFSSVCPQLKTVELRCVCFSASALEGFVERRVKSNLDDPALGLVTSLTLDSCQIGEELRERFVHKYSSSITFK